MSQFNAPYECVFEAVISDANSMLRLMKSVLVEEKPNTVFELSDDGIRLVVEKNKVLQGSVLIRKDCFDEFKFRNHSTLTLNFDLRYLLNCLGVITNAAEGDSDHSKFQNYRPSLGSDAKSLRMRLETDDSALELLCEGEGDDDNQLRCTVAAQEKGTSVVLFPPVDPVDILYRVIIKSELLLELWEDLDHSSEKLWIKMSNNEDSCFVMTTKSEIAQVELTVDTKQVLEFKSASEEPVILCFRLSLFKITVRTICLSQKAVILFTKDGRMVIQLSILDNDAGELMQWVEYHCASLSEDKERDEFQMSSVFRRSATIKN